MPQLDLPQSVYDRICASAQRQDVSPEDYVASLLPSNDGHFQNLYESEIHFKQIIEHLRDIIFLKTADNAEMIYVSDLYDDIWGRPHAELYQNPLIFLDYVHPEDLHRVQQHLAMTSNKHKKSQEEYRVIRPDNSIVWVKSRTYPVSDEHGEISQIVGIIEDITPRKQIEQELQEAKRHLEQRVDARTKELASVNEQLRASERRYRAISELSTDYAYSYQHVDDKFVLEWVTDAFTAVTGLSEDTIATLENMSHIVHPDDLENFTKNINLLKTQEAILQFECKLLIDGGHSRTMFMRYQSEVYTESDAIVRIMGVVQDITARKDIEDALMLERNLHQKLVETTPTGIVLFNKLGRATFANQRATEILQLSLQEILQNDPDNQQWEIQDFQGNPLPRSEVSFELVMQSGKALHDLRHRLKLKNGNIIYLSINGAPLMDKEGEIQQVIFSIDDITQQVLLEQQQQLQMEREQELLALKSNFVTLVSHELRTPMSLILTSAQIVEKQAQTISPEKIENRMGKITKQVMRLRRIMEDVSFINRFDEIGHQLQLEELDLNTFCQEFIEDSLTVTNTTVSVQLTMQTNNTKIVTDKTLLEQIFGNLLTNALKYTPENGDVMVRCAVADGNYRIEVEDTGIGIPQEESDALFENFFRASNVSNIAGTGLGLGIIRRALNALDGTIEWESEVNRGTRFLVTLPQQEL